MYKCVPGENAGCVLDRLALAELDVGGAQVDGRAAAEELEARLEAGAGPEGGLCEDHAQGFACEGERRPRAAILRWAQAPNLASLRGLGF